MTRARQVWWLGAGLGLVSVTVTVATLAVALTRVQFSVPSGTELARACRQWALPHLRPGSLLVLAVGSVALTAIALTVRSFVRQVRAARALEARLPVAGRLDGHANGFVLDDPRPHAFCIGWLRPRVYVSVGALQALEPEERAAVLAHERHHARRRDPLRLAFARALGEGLFFVPAVRRLAERYAALAEVAADEAAVRAGRGSSALASALLAFDAHPSPAVVGIAPERVDHLLGRRPGWELPVLVLLGGVATLVLIVAVTVRIAEATDHASIGLPALAAQACMLAMALVPVMAGAAALTGATRRRRRRGPQPARGGRIVSGALNE